MMKNKRGKTVHERLNEEIECAEKTSDKEHQRLLALAAMGAVDFAVDFGLITYIEWGTYTNRIVAIS